MPDGVRYRRAEPLPFEARGAGKCILTGQPSQQRVVMAKAY
jgi:hypothetical protein